MTQGQPLSGIIIHGTPPQVPGKEALRKVLRAVIYLPFLGPP